MYMNKGNSGNPGNNYRKRPSNNSTNTLNFRACKKQTTNSHNQTCRKVSIPRKCIPPGFNNPISKIEVNNLNKIIQNYKKQLQDEIQNECDIPWIDEESYDPNEWDISIFGNSNNATQPESQPSSGTPSSGGKKTKTVKKADKKPKSTAKKSSSKKSGGKTEKKSTKISTKKKATKKAAKKTTKNTLLKKCDQKQGLA